ncbi:unnamed protein product [Closterium sp. NIES-65]|nr:unnamed protein product [Closterium sp. NIES-65]
MLSATNNWSEDNVLGKGGFGVVYKGRSPQGQLWAIKRSTIMTNDFETEVRAMASLHHTHLVCLLGFCLDQNMETAKQKLRLAQGAAEGLAYLHRFDTPIVHRDIKPANILVTADMQAKVADFGLLKRLTHADADATRVASTPGYVDPDYNRTNLITAKSDVFRGAEGQQDVGGKEAIVDFADLALDYIKSPGTRRPTMKDVAYRLSALIAKHCPDKEDEWESGAKEESPSSDGMSSRDVSVVSSRERERSDGSQSGVSSFMHIGSIGDGFRGWLHLKPAKGR